MLVTEAELLAEYGRQVAAVYAITNKVNGKIYVGRTSCYIARRACHFSELRHGIHHNPHLQAAFDKYGADQFQMSILVPCTLDELEFYEQMYMDILKAADRRYGYNINPNADGSGIAIETARKRTAALRGKKHDTRWVTPEVRQAMSERNKGNQNYFYGRKIVHSPEVIARAAAARRGRKDSEATKEKKRLAAKNRPPPSDETKERLRRAAIGKHFPQLYKPVLQFTRDGQFIASYDSIKSAKKATGAPTIGPCCRGERHFSGGFIWKWGIK